jgi:hypothetical protein
MECPKHHVLAPFIHHVRTVTAEASTTKGTFAGTVLYFNNYTEMFQILKYRNKNIISLYTGPN